MTALLSTDCWTTSSVNLRLALVNCFSLQVMIGGLLWLAKKPDKILLAWGFSDSHWKTGPMAGLMGFHDGLLKEISVQKIKSFQWSLTLWGVHVHTKAFLCQLASATTVSWASSISIYSFPSVSSSLTLPAVHVWFIPVSYPFSCLIGTS